SNYSYTSPNRYYSASIITMTGITQNNASLAIWISALTSTINFLGTFIGLFLVDRIGRRPLTIASLSGTALALLGLALTFQLSYVNSPKVTFDGGVAENNSCLFESCGVCTSKRECGFCFEGDTEGNYTASCVLSNHSLYDEYSVYGDCSNTTLAAGGIVVYAYDWCPYQYAWITIIALGLYLLFFSSGMAPMPWTINSEIYPNWARATCTSITTSINWSANLLVSLTFLTLTEVLLKHGTFYLYMCVAVCGCVCFTLLLPETRGVPLEQMGDLFSLPVLQRIKKRY
ncbi:hypothetical protein Pmani_028242, partial [Petrolisthes manimaculis]